MPINSNFLVGGLNNVPNFYIDSLGGRKAAISNKTSMGKSGHFSRKIMLLSTDIVLSKETDCNTIHPLLIEIKTPEHLRRLTGRYCKSPRRLGSRYEMITANSTHFIGTEVLLRSPITCNCKTGVCHTCYGELSYTNSDINSIGGLAGSKTTEPISQNILSTKHHLATTSKMIKFKDSFYNLFSINSNEIMLTEDNEDIDFSNYSLILLQDNIIAIDEYCTDRDFNRFMSIFHVKNNKTGEIEEYMEEDEMDMYFSKEFNEIIEETRAKVINDDQQKAYEINLGNLETGMAIFAIEVENKEITKPLYDIMDLLDKDSHNGCSTVDEMAQRMVDLMIISKIDVMSVHGELLIKPLIRKGNDIIKFIDWGMYEAINNYQILTVTRALIYHPSPTISISFQDLGRQLVNPLTFRKTATSFLDPFYKERP